MELTAKNSARPFRGASIIYHTFLFVKFRRLKGRLFLWPKTGRRRIAGAFVFPGMGSGQSLRFQFLAFFRSFSLTHLGILDIRQIKLG